MSKVEKTEKTFEVNTPASLEVSNIRGKVDIQPHDSAKILVDVTVYLDTGDPELTEIHLNQLADNLVEIKTKHDLPKGLFHINSQPCRVDYVIKVPQQCSVKLRSVNNETVVEGLEGNFDIKSVNGALHITDLDGEMSIKSVNGRLKAKNLNGPAVIETVSGRAEILDSNLPSLRVSSVSGKLIVESPLGEGPYHFSSVSGHIKLVVPETTECSISAKSLSGSVKTDLTTTSTNNVGRNWSVDLNGGGALVNMNSVSGSLHILSDLNATGQRPRVQKKTKADRINVLNQLEGGEISVDEAVKQLNL